MYRLMVLLVVLAMFSAASVILIRNQSRSIFIQAQAEQKSRDDLNIEWNKLLTERSTWSVYRVEKKAREDVGLVKPNQEQVNYIWLDELK